MQSSDPENSGTMEGIHGCFLSLIETRLFMMHVSMHVAVANINFSIRYFLSNEDALLACALSNL